MGHPIDKITLKGFKSIRDLEDFPLRNLNILIGANGAGKSNFVSFFTFLFSFAYLMPRMPRAVNASTSRSSVAVRAPNRQRQGTGLRRARR